MTAHPRKIALICPGAGIDRDLARNVGDFAAARYSHSVELIFHQQCFLSHGHFAGSDEARSDAFLEVANNPDIDAVWFARGGYGACRLKDSLYDALNDAARRKTYLGHSDTGVILARLHQMRIGLPVHGPVAAEMAYAGGEACIKRALDFLVRNDRSGTEPTARERAPVVAFNITVLASIISADWAPSLAGHIVMLEDIGEYLYRIDRSFGAIFNAPKMRGARGVKLGRISQIPENDRPFGADEEEICRYWCERAEIPYLGRADIGHDADNKITPFRHFD